METKFVRFAVDTKFIKLGVETNPVRLGIEIKGRTEEASSAGSIKLLMYRSRPAVVEMRFGLEIKFRRFWVDTKLRRFCVETKLRRFCVDTKLIKLGVETNPVRLGMEIKGRTEEASSAGSIKLLMYLSKPAVVEMRFGLEIRLRRFCVDTKLRRFCVDTKLRRFCVETKLRRFCVDTKLIKLGVETNPVRLGMEIKGRTEEASSAGSIKLLIYRSRPAVVEMRFGEEIKFRRFCVDTKLSRF